METEFAHVQRVMEEQGAEMAQLAAQNLSLETEQAERMQQMKTLQHESDALVKQLEAKLAEMRKTGEKQAAEAVEHCNRIRELTEQLDAERATLGQLSRSREVGREERKHVKGKILNSNIHSLLNLFYFVRVQESCKSLWRRSGQ